MNAENFMMALVRAMKYYSTLEKARKAFLDQYEMNKMDFAEDIKELKNDITSYDKLQMFNKNNKKMEKPPLYEIYKKSHLDDDKILEYFAELDFNDALTRIKVF